jgi:hypothetical protein
MSEMAAAFNVAHDFEGGARALALKIGENPNTFSHALTGTAGAALRIITCRKMGLMARDFRILHAFAAEQGFMCVPLPESLDLGSNDVMKAMADASKEFAELVRETCSAMSDDGDISDNEMARFERELGESMATHQKLLAVVRAYRERKAQERKLASGG